MGRPAAAHATWPQRRGGGLSLVTGRPRDLARARKALSARPRRVQYSFLRMSIYSFLLQHDRCCRRRHQRHGRSQERSGPEMYTVSCTPRTSPFPNPRRPLVSVSSRSRRIRKLLPQLCVCVSRLVTMVCRWCTRSLGRLNFLDLLLRHNALVGGRPGPRKKADEHSSTR